jgi:hypothetical protein
MFIFLALRSPCHCPYCSQQRYKPTFTYRRTYQPISEEEFLSFSQEVVEEIVEIVSSYDKVTGQKRFRSWWQRLVDSVYPSIISFE